MQAKSGTSGTTVLVVVILILTFPIWIGILGGLFGVIMGIFGALIGVIGAFFGAIFGMIGGLFDWMFGWNWHCPFGFGNHPFLTVFLIVFAIVLVSRSGRFSKK